MSEPSAPPGGTVVRRIRFTSDAAPSGRVCRTFKRPRACAAVEETAALTDVPPAPADGELFVVVVPAKGAAAVVKQLVAVLATTDPDAPTLDVTWRGDRVVWRPGLAVVYHDGPVRDELQAAVVEFAFYEGELRRLEAELDAREALAPEDVARSQTISRRDKAHWPRIRETVEALYRMRFEFARLAPRLAEEASAPGPVERRFASHLLRHARAGVRAEALDVRLESCEDLYEGANDRIADYKGWHTGHVLEIIIVVVLLVEVVLLCLDLYVNWVHGE